MTYVYLLESVSFPGQWYVGHTDDLRTRLAAHNAGQSPHTAKYKPWRLVTYVAFSDEAKAIAFERLSQERVRPCLREEAVAIARRYGQNARTHEEPDTSHG